ncbi:MAG: hypothetical protein M0D57_04655 [Sphingobacteriales bacterium JAD_PAG50586_3]|nr:MAG: hypothetical protein M0D57_04655 [Sphingobacteriales bacterium JAD_PAG50586_3]
MDNQDCLVLVSSVLPQNKITYNDVVVLTNDSAFVSSYDTPGFKAILDKHTIFSPELIGIRKLPGDINLTNSTIANLELKVRTMVGDLLVKKLKNLFLGKTFVPQNPNFPINVICFKLVENYILPRDVYITVIGKNLDFIYTTRKKIHSFRLNNTELPDKYNSPVDRTENISFKIVDVDEVGQETHVIPEIMNSLKQEGNFIYIHPDSSF